MTEVKTAADEAQARPEHRRRGRRMLAWFLVACWALWAAGRLAGVDRTEILSPVLIPAMAAVPYAAVTSVVPLVAAIVSRDRAAIAVATVVTVLFACIVVPRSFAGPQPDAKGPELRILTANLRFGLAGDASLVALVRRTRADVLSVQEFTPDAARRLDEAGIARLLPYRVLAPRRGPEGTGLYARYPLTALPSVGPTTFAMPSATLAVPGTAPVRVTAAHPPAPFGADIAKWRHDLGEIPPVTPDGQVSIVAGDFNASLDHAVLRKIIGRGFTDAANATGQGLVPTFRPFPPITIDHVLADRRCAVLGVKVFFQPASDHRALFATLRLP